jgi:hypothetical protein
LSWTDNSTKELNYTLQRSTTPDFALGTVTNIVTPLHDNGPLGGGTTVSFTDTTNPGITTYYYRVAAANFEGTTTFSNSVPVLPFTGGEQPGAEAHWYINTWWKSGFANGDLAGGTTGTVVGGASQSPDLNQILTNVNQSGADPTQPAPGIRGNNFSVVYTGKIIITNPGVYVFPTRTDDDSYLYVDGQLVASDPKPHGIELPPNVSQVTLSAGAHDFQFFVSQQGGGWDMHLDYTGPDTGGDATVTPVVQGTNIPQNALSTVSSPVVAPGAISFTNVSNSSVQINWGDTNISEIQYIVERSSDNFVNDIKVVGTTGINGNSLVDTNVPAGTFTYRVHAVNFDSTGAAVTAVLDHQPPTVVASAYHFDAHPSTFTIQFSEDVSASLASNPIIVANLTTPGSVPYTGSYNAATNTYTMTFAATLPNANYRVTAPATVKDAAGNSLATFTGDFFVLKGDVNRDRSVGFADLVAVAQHYGKPGQTYTTGDLDGDGQVGFSDLVAVAQNYGKSVPAPGASPAPAAASVDSSAILSLGMSLIPKTAPTTTTNTVTTPVTTPVVTPVTTPVSKPVSTVTSTPKVIKTVIAPVIKTVKAAPKPVIAAKPTASAFSTTRISTVVKKKNDLFN